MHHRLVEQPEHEHRMKYDPRISLNRKNNINFVAAEENKEWDFVVSSTPRNT